MAFFCVGDRQHALTFTVQGAEPLWIVASVETVDEGEICKVIHVRLDGKHHNHTDKQSKIS